MDFGILDDSLITIKVIGVGGAGNNAVNKMCDSDIEGVEFWACNTDYQILNRTKTENRILLGPDITHGQGAGAHPEVGKRSADASADPIRNALRGADMVFIAAGMGGGTGTGASPIIAKICQELGILTVAIVTRPFAFEGKERNLNATEGLKDLRPFVDSLIVINNDQLLDQCKDKPYKEAFGEADEVLCKSVKTITDLILKPGIINRDFADVETVMKDKGTALIGMGLGHGPDKALMAARNACSSLLLETPITGAKQAIVQVEGGENTTLLDINTAVEEVRSMCADEDVNIIFGFAEDETLIDGMRVVVIATEFKNDVHGEIKPIEEIAPVEEPLEVAEEENEEEEEFLSEEDDGSTPNFFRRRKLKKRRNK